MRKQFLGAVALVVMALMCAGEASALVQRTFVSGLGSDTNPCTRAQPCRTFAAAIAQTLPGGEVIVLDTAGYGPVAITQAISLISPPGVYAGISTTTLGTNGITIDAGVNDVVVLKGLSLSGLGLGELGVLFNSGKALRVENLTISGFAAGGIEFFAPATARLTVADSLIRDNGGGGVVAFADAAAQARVAIDRTRLIGNDSGVIASTNGRVTVRDSVADGNANAGFWAAAEGAVLNLENSLSNDNDTGVLSDALVRVAGTTVTNNTTGLATGEGGSILSRGNNTVEGNDTNGIFTSLFAPK